MDVYGLRLSKRAMSGRDTAWAVSYTHLVNVVKKSKHDDVTLEGATFGLYAEEDLTAADGKVLVEKGSLVERAVSDREGMAVFHADIPLNFHYSVKEIQAPDKYYMTDEVYRFFYEYKDDSTYTYTFSHDFKNEEVRGEVHVSKIDQDSQGFISCLLYTSRCV